MLREAVAAGEPLNPEVIEQVAEVWGITVRDGYGQTETTAMIGNSPGQRVKLGSMGRALPGYAVSLLDPMTGEEGDDGEIVLSADRPPLGLMAGYGDAESASGSDGIAHRTGDLAARDEEGYFTYVGRVDDVFKASDYRISPFELESVLIESVAVAEAAVVPSPHPLRGSVPKAYVSLTAGFEPTAETAILIFDHCRQRVAPYKRIRRLEFVRDLPKTISGKIRRVELRDEELARLGGGDETRAPTEYWEEEIVIADARAE
jgi:acetyl-CoA synthetase